MKTYDEAIEYINHIEKLKIDYCKIGEKAKILIVSFAVCSSQKYDRKSSLLKLKYERNDLDLLYIKNPKNWYLGGITGVGENINQTIEFLKEIFEKYDKVICVGISMGGYASILFGSLLNVNYVVACRPQTDLDYVIEKCRTENLCQARLGLSKVINFETFQKYKNLNKIINNSTIFYVKSPFLKDGYHDIHHYNNIKHFKNVKLLERKNNPEELSNITPIVTDILEEVS